ncbi:hypothetical protein BDF22DRAFT_212486 [Syncephalis plumigaleata]|nr:hypothetical protein BDF22DRAFT_212486 [Syncephalis plumigaleata]
MNYLSDRTPLLQERALRRESEISTSAPAVDVFSQHTLELTLVVCQIVPDTEEAVVSPVAVSDLANKALQIISLRHHGSQTSGGAVGETAHSLLRAAARCATRAREDTFRRPVWQIRKHVCVKAALESLFRLANQRSEMEYNSMAQVSGVDDDITDRMLVYANGLLVPHVSNDYSVLDFALKTGLDEILQNQHVQCCIEAFWHGDIVPVWPILNEQTDGKPYFWLERANEGPKPTTTTTTPASRLTCVKQRVCQFIGGLLRPERALAPMYFGMISALGYVGFFVTYLYLLLASDYRWGTWSLIEVIVYGWSLLYIFEMSGKVIVNNIDISEIDRC